MTDEELGKRAVVPLITAPMEPGTRVGVFASYTKTPDGRKVLRFYGWGWYEGDFPLGDNHGVRSYQSADEKIDHFNQTGEVCVPRLRLEPDNTITWGSLCWFDEEFVIKDIVDNADVIEHVSLKRRMAWFNAEQENLRDFREAANQINNFQILEG